MPIRSTHANGELLIRMPMRPGSASVSSGATVLILVGLAVTAVLSYALTGSVISLLVMGVAGAVVFGWRIGLQDSIGIFLLLMSVQYIVIALLQFNGVRQYQQISAIKDVILLAAPLWFLAKTKSFELAAADVVLAIALLYVCASQIFQPDIQGARVDWEWALPYFLGRLMVLSPSMQALWAKCAVWTCAVLSIIGGWEVFVLGPEPRKLLVQVTFGENHLDPTFFATGYSGFRAASTTVSPLVFSAFCMVSLLLWWVYMKNPLPALLVGTGLILTLTRSATLMVLLGITVIALRRKERARILGLTLVVAVGLAIAIPTLELSKYVAATFSSHSDISLVGHEASISQGVTRMVDNPLGTGAGTVGPRAILKSTSALDIENSYLTIAVEYGIVPGVLFCLFVVMCLWRLYSVRKPIGYAAFSVLLGFAFLLSVGPVSQELAISTWVWFIVGQGMSQSTNLISPE